ncbi:MAG: hypothetical protein GT597_12560 [Bacteroidales bacterium]|jgi:hypothetical protein|nr:hypothetical protein [Bacteroidales bacterium]
MNSRKLLPILILIMAHMCINTLSSQDLDTMNYVQIDKSKVQFEIYDRRPDKLNIGRFPVGITWIEDLDPKRKVKDKYNLAFPLVKDLFQKELTSNGFNSNDELSDSLIINLTFLFYQIHDKVTYRGVDQNCTINVLLYDKDKQSPIFVKEYLGTFSSSVADLKRMGYKMSLKDLRFLTPSIKNSIQELFKDTEFTSLFSN